MLTNGNRTRHTRTHLGHFGRRQVVGELVGGPARDARRVARPVVIDDRRRGLDACREHLNRREAFDLRGGTRAKGERVLHNVGMSMKRQLRTS